MVTPTSSTSRAPVVKAGDIIEGRYRVIKTLDEGGMGTVFLAEHVLIKRKVAIKILHPELAKDPEVIERFMNEASVAGTLGHPNIVESTDMGFTKGEVPFIVFEYLEGSLLTDEIYRVSGLTVRRSLKIANQIASALEAAHSAGIIHRDLKSDNIFLTDRDGVTDHVKVLDFGVSRFIEAETDNSRQKKMVVGTPEYMAPEQILTPDRVDGRADIYALGIVLYESMTGRRPFRNTGDTDALLHRIIHEPPPPLTRGEAPPGLQEMLFNQLLAKDPSKRYQTMKDVQLAIAAFSGILRPSGSITPMSVRVPTLPLDVKLASGTPSPRAEPTPIPRTATQPPRTVTEPGKAERTKTDLPRSEPPPATARAKTHADVGKGTGPATALPIAPKKRRAPVGLLLLSLVTAGAGVGVMFVPPEKTSTTAVPLQVLQADAKTVSASFEAVASANYLRAEGLALSPMLRAAIETDSATLKDMLHDSDFVFAPKKDEVLEIYQKREGAAPTLMLRLPESATRSVKPMSGIRYSGEGDAVIAIAGVPVSTRSGSATGFLVISSPIDLAPVKRNIAEHTLKASLEGFDKPILLSDSGTPGAEVKIPIELAGAALLSLVAVIAPPTATESERFRWVRLGCWAGGGFLLMIYLVLLLRGARQR